MRYIRAVTLLELIIAITLFVTMVIGFASLDIFSRTHVISADRRIKLQNEITYAIEMMSKDVQNAVGYVNRPAIQQIANGFRVYVEPATPTPGNHSDDIMINYTLSTNNLSRNSDILSTHILSGVVYNTTMPSSPTQGFYINITNNNSTIEVGLAARQNPNKPVDVDNPQVALKTTLYSRQSASH